MLKFSLLILGLYCLVSKGMLNHKLLKQLQHDLKDQNTHDNRRLSVLLRKYRNHNSEPWCPVCWTYRLCGLVVIVLLTQYFWN